MFERCSAGIWSVYSCAFKDQCEYHCHSNTAEDFQPHLAILFIKMQQRVAKEIAKAEELTSIAKALGISTNTIRTHIKRMFERVGLNNQKALLNRLLSKYRSE